MAQLKLGTVIGGNTVWHAGNDGTGSGLDADLLDGQHSSYFQPALGYTPVNKAGDSITGNISITGDLSVTGNITGTVSGNAPTVSTITTSTNANYYLTFVDSNNATATAESIYTTNKLFINPSTGNVTITGDLNVTGTISDDSLRLKYRGSVAEASLDSAISNGFYSVSKTGYSSSLLTWNVGGSTGPVQIDVNYFNEIRYRSQTDSTTWNAWKTLLHSNNFNSYAPTLTGTGASGTWGINITGSAGSAGSAATLTTARTLTIGSTGKTFNGSANVSWTTSEIGAEFEQPLNTPRSNLGNPTVREAALFDEQFNNKIAFYDISKVFFETSADNITWESFAVSDTQKRRFLGGDTLATIVIPNGTAYFRIRIRAVNYVYLNAFYAYTSTNGHSTKIHVYKKHDLDTEWTAVATSNTLVSSWPGHFYLPHSNIPFRETAVQGTHVHEVYVVFIPTWNASFPSNNIDLQKGQWWGGYPAGKRNVYTTDENANISLPAGLTVSGNVGVGTATANAKLHVVSGANTALILQANTNQDTFRFLKQDGSTLWRAVWDTSNFHHYLTGGNLYYNLNGNAFIIDGNANSNSGFRITNSAGFQITPNIDGSSRGIISGNSNYATAAVPLVTNRLIEFGTWAWNGTDGSSLWSKTEIVQYQLSATQGSARLGFVSKHNNTELISLLTINGNFGINNTNPAEKLDVAGNIKHTGLVLTEGSNVDQITTITKNLTLTQDWQDTGIKSTDLATGSYMVQLYANDTGAGGTNSNEYYSGTMSWYSGDTDSSVELPTDEIVLHRAGGSGDGALYLRTYRTASANPDNLKLQIYSNVANASASNYVFKFRRLI